MKQGAGRGRVGGFVGTMRERDFGVFRLGALFQVI